MEGLGRGVRPVHGSTAPPERDSRGAAGRFLVSSRIGLCRRDFPERRSAAKVRGEQRLQPGVFRLTHFSRFFNSQRMDDVQVSLGGPLCSLIEFLPLKTLNVVVHSFKYMRCMYTRHMSPPDSTSSFSLYPSFPPSLTHLHATDRFVERSILHLSVGDPVASVVGVRLGDRNRVLPSGKSLAVRGTK